MAGLEKLWATWKKDGRFVKNAVDSQKIAVGHTGHGVFRFLGEKALHGCGRFVVDSGNTVGEWQRCG